MIDHDYLAADTTREYLIPMSRIEDDEHNEHLVRVAIKECDKGRAVTLEKEGYRTKRMYKEYFSWLIYTNYIKVLDKA